MLVDFLDSSNIVQKIPVVPLPGTSNDRNTLVSLGYWEEHCIECGAPICYKTCEKFAPTLSGKCRRFSQGVRRVKFADGTYGVSVSFLPWGKMELCHRGMMCNNSTLNFLDRWDRFIAPLARFMTRLLFFLPWNRNPIALVRSARIRLLRLLPHRRCNPRVLLLECYCEGAQNLRLSVMNYTDEEILTGELAIKKGWNSFEFKLPETTGRCRARLFSIDGTTAPILFRRLDLMVRCGEKDVATHAKFVKCVAWDLDNTLWKGILVEDGPAGIKLRDESVKVIKELDRRGIMNTICSKNDFECAFEQLKRFDLAEYFVFPEINWNPKSDNLRSIAKNMNIGLDSFAFVDDSKNERGEVADALPMVRVFDEKHANGILRLDCFNPPVTEASATRRLSYLAEMARKRVEKGFSGPRNDFLRSCKIILRCEHIRSGSLSHRCWELVNRTNQLTLAARRYGESEFSNLIKGENNEAYAVCCTDKYGDYGVVGFVLISVDGTVANVAEFVMSCRVAKKYCEQSVLLSIAERLRDRGVDRLETEVVPTGRNGALIEAFEAMPFSKQEPLDANKRRYRYILKLTKLEDHIADVFRNEVVFD